MKTRKPETIDEYLADLSDDKRAALIKLRKDIKTAAPKVEGCISYQPDEPLPAVLVRKLVRTRVQAVTG